MDKNAIKKYAVWARRELIERVSQCAYQYAVMGDNPNPDEHRTMEGRPLSEKEQRQRERLVAEVKAHGYQQTMEAAAYTWFNRFAGIRFMEVNGYLPSGVRVFSGDDGTFQPEILKQCVTMDEEWLDKEKIFALKEANDTDELYKYLVIAQCNALGEILPAMFERIADWTELLFPEHLLREGSVLSHLVTDIAEDDWRDAVQIIGWLYQYYNTEPKDDVFAALKKNKKITKETIPAATQLFTPDWIVRYMVENSLGRYWLERHPECSAEEFGWRYYLPEAKQTPEVAAKLASIREASAGVSPEDIRFIDPCMGSGHILVYAFDVLYAIYKAVGYQPRKIAALILEKNLYGLDIDARAYQLATFAVMMKARQYDRNIFMRGIVPHLAVIEESNGLTKWEPEGELTLDATVIEEVNGLIDAFYDAKEYGSLLTIAAPREDLLERWEALKENATGDLMLGGWMGNVDEVLASLVKQARILSQKYEIVATNPPYMGGGFGEKLSNFLVQNYLTGKYDLYAAFIEKCMSLTKLRGKTSLVTMHSWMFIYSYKAFRQKILENNTVEQINHLGMEAFENIQGKLVSTVAFVISPEHLANYRGRAIDLTSYFDATRHEKEPAFFYGKNRYTYVPDTFFKIPDSPFAYWATAKCINTFSENKHLDDVLDCRSGIMAGNERYIKYWYEVNIQKINLACLSYEDMGDKTWFPLNSGGDYRMWYGNNEKIIDLYDNGAHIRENVRNYRLRERKFYFKKGITWGRISSAKTSFRDVTPGTLFGDAGPVAFIDQNRYLVLGFLASNVSEYLLKVLNPTVNSQVRDLLNLPLIESDDGNDEIQELVEQNISIEKEEWDSSERSWNFQKHPLMIFKNMSLSMAYETYKQECDQRFMRMKRNEETLNKKFIQRYGLEKEVSYEVDERNVSITRVFDEQNETSDKMRAQYVLLKSDVAQSFLSYAVGCMFGRYSLDEECLVYAGGEWDATRYHKYQPDHDDIIPICDADYFEDDIVGRFCQWMQAAFGAEHLEENLKWVADALGGSGSPREVIRKYFLSGFFADHCKRYQKRPIYWLFDAGGKNSFKALMYVHRYDRDTVARLRTGYVYKQQEFFKTKVNLLEQRVDKAASTSERNKAKKELKRISIQLDEIHAYEERVHHLADRRIEIDLDDGVKHNYALFQDILATIK